jgi:hypothetical protein
MQCDGKSQKEEEYMMIKVRDEYRVQDEIEEMDA